MVACAFALPWVLTLRMRSARPLPINVQDKWAADDKERRVNAHAKLEAELVNLDAGISQVYVECESLLDKMDGATKVVAEAGANFMTCLSPRFLPQLWAFP